MCDTCVTDPPITALEIAAHDPQEIVGWIGYNAPVEFLRFVTREYPDAVAEYMNVVKAHAAEQHLLAHAAGN